MDRASLSMTALAAVLFLAGAVRADQRHTRLLEGTPVIVVGRISSPPKGELNEQKMQVAVGPRRVDYTLHFGDAIVKAPNGDMIDEDRLDDGQWVRAEGYVMDDPRRIRVTRMRVISPHDEMVSLRGSPYNRPGHPYGYIMWPKSMTAGWRSYYRAAQ